MTAFPFARFMRHGGRSDDLRQEDIMVSSRNAHSPLAASAAPTYSFPNVCGDAGGPGDIELYAATGFEGRMGINTSK